MTVGYRTWLSPAAVFADWQLVGYIYYAHQAHFLYSSAVQYADGNDLKTEGSVQKYSKGKRKVVSKIIHNYENERG